MTESKVCSILILKKKKVLSIFCFSLFTVEVGINVYVSVYLNNKDELSV